MKTYIQPGDTLTLTAPTNVPSGGGVLIGSIFGIACNDALTGTEVETKLTGVFEMQKVAAEGWSVGDLVYWSRSDNLATAKAAGNALIGVAVATSANPSGTGKVRLNGVFANPNPIEKNASRDKSASVVMHDQSANALIHDAGMLTNSTSTSKP